MVERRLVCCSCTSGLRCQSMSGLHFRILSVRVYVTRSHVASAVEISAHGTVPGGDYTRGFCRFSCGVSRAMALILSRIDHGA